MNIVTHGFRAENTVVALGNFDGVHRGHQLLLSALLSHTDKTPIVFTFDRHPFSVLSGKAMPLITTNDEKCALLRAYGINTVYMAHSTPSFLQTDANAFVEQYLVKELGATHVVVGSDCRFGKNGSGTPLLLQEMGKALGFCVTCLEKLYDGQTEISSSRIRQLLTDGDVARAEALMGHPYTISGTVVPGRHVGTSLGFPTMNLALPKDKIMPAPGVYASQTQIGDSVHLSISFVGTSPTYQTQTPLIETHILDASEDLYGETVTVSFRRFIRPTMHFPSPEALIRQVETDIKSIKEGEPYA